LKPWLKTLIKFLIVALLFYFLANKGLISVDRTKKALERPDLLSAGFAIFFLCNFIGAWRWQILLRAHGMDLGYWKTVHLTFVGSFFNVALPGAVSGDLIKAFYIGKKITGSRANAFGSIVFDRIIGVSALGLVAGGALIYDYQSLEGHALLAGVKTIILASMLGIVAFYSYLFLMKEDHDFLLKFFRTCEGRWERFGSVTRIYLGVRHYHSYRGAVAKALAMSLVIHLVIGYACGLYAQAIGAGEFPLSALYVVVPLGLLVTAVPVAPAGVGTGHVAFATLFSLLGSPMGADIFSLVALTNFAIGGIGGLTYLRYKSEVPAISDNNFA